MTIYGQRRGNNFIRFTARSSASSIRKNGVVDRQPVVNEHYKQLEHVYTVTAQTGFDVQRRIDRVRAKAGEDARTIDAPVNGHVKIAPQIVRQRNGNLGLACEVLSWGESEYRNVNTGDVVDPAYLAPFKPKTSGDIDYLTPNLNNLLSITIDGETFEIDASDYDDTMTDLAEEVPGVEEIEANKAA